jgi:DNA-directed RNA polymerase specialized sigma subunit
MGNQYINNREFETIINKFLTAKKNIKSNKSEYDKLQKELAIVFYLLADNIIKAFNFKLIDHEDALQEGVMICFEKIDRFCPEKGKAFNYMTTCCLNHYRQLYRTAKSYMELKNRFQDFIAKKTLENLLQHTNKVKRTSFKKMEQYNSEKYN